MGKEHKTAEELAALIAQQMNVGGAFIKVVKDSVYGWRAVAMMPPAQAMAYQAEIENIVAELRVHYDLTI